jgi:hypothetical protein
MEDSRHQVWAICGSLTWQKLPLYFCPLRIACDSHKDVNLLEVTGQSQPVEDEES